MSAAVSTLVLSQSYEALDVVSWERALTLWYQGKAEVVAEHETLTARSMTLTIKLPLVIRLLRYVRLKRRPVVQFTRANVYMRDDYTCGYCEQRFAADRLTYDHVLPVSQGGTRGWTNIVTACEPCNRRKADRTPEQAGMKLMTTPRRPAVLAPTVKVTVGWKTPTSWRPYLYVRTE